jgi:hypothetical protein
MSPILRTEILIGYRAMAGSLPYSPDLSPVIFTFLDLFRKNVADKQFATDAELKPAIISWLQTLDNDLFYTGTQALLPR